MMHFLPLSIRLYLTASLLVLAGCRRDVPAPSPPAVATERPADDAPPAKSASRVFLTQQADGFFEFPFLASNNLDQFIDEVNEREIRKLKLKPHSWSSAPSRLSIEDQLSVLPKIFRGCPHVEAFDLSGWTLRISDLAVAVQSENLQELAISSCIVVDDGSDIAKPGPSSLQKLSLTSCLAGQETRSDDGELNVFWTDSIDDRWSRLLAWTPTIEELHVWGSFRDEGSITGNDWPLATLTNLRTVHLGDYVQDALVERMLTQIPKLESLSLSGEQLTGDGWMPDKLSAIRDLELYGCEGIPPEKLEAVFPSAPQLESFSLRVWRDSLTAAFDFSNSPNLRTLSIAAPNGKTNLNFQGLPAAANLESLTLRGLSPEALSSVHLSQFPKLRSLDLASYGATQHVLAGLPASLESIRLTSFAKANPDIADTDVSFSHLTRLQSFTFESGLLEAELLESLPSNVTSLALHHCDVPNSSIATLLSRLDRLETLSLTWLHGGRGYAGDPGVITGDGWDFACRDRLRTLDLSKCFYLKDELISQISEQLTGLESLKLSEHRNLTGRNWQLDRLPKLKDLDLRELAKLTDNMLQQLPASLESLRVEDCDALTGESWQLDPLGKLTELQIAKCDSLRSLGSELPGSLQTLHAYYCPELLCSDLEYSSFTQLQSFSMTDCYRFDVKRLFADLPRYADSLRTLTLTGCESLKDSNWDMSALNDTLQIVIYNEAEPAYRGGLNKELGEQLQRQLPDCVIVL